jgi:SH3 domain protein
VLKVEGAKGYSQIRTSAGLKGWLPSALLTQTPSSQEQLAGVRQELDQLKARHGDLQHHMDTVVNKPGAETASYPQLYEEAQRLRQQLAEYRKVAADSVAIAESSQRLQEQSVTQERELQIVQQENQALRNENENMRFLMGTVILWVCLLAAVVLPRLREQKRAQWNRL